MYFLCLKCYVFIASFQALINEKEKFVQNSISQLIGIITKHEFPNQWDEVIDFIRLSVESENSKTKEVSKS
jgi:hypothetical protein